MYKPCVTYMYMYALLERKIIIGGWYRHLYEYGEAMMDCILFLNITCLLYTTTNFYVCLFSCEFFHVFNYKANNLVIFFGMDVC